MNIPQLMPMNWIFSSSMLMIIMMSICMLYSEKISSISVNKMYFKANNNLNLWCW